MADYSKDPYHLRCYADVKEFFDSKPNSVFYSRQIELLFEQKYFHWITNKAIRDLVSSNLIISSTESLSFGGTVNLYWNKRNRYYKRQGKRIKELVEAYSAPNVTASIGDQGELLVNEAFARNGFITAGVEANSYNGKEWTETGHDLDYIMERDGIAYCIEIKNTLPYMDKKEFNIKIAMCREIGVIPLLENRYFPTTWAQVLNREGGYAFFMKYQLYPRAFKSLVKDLSEELELPVGCPIRIEQGTMDRFIKWHNKSA